MRLVSLCKSPSEELSNGLKGVSFSGLPRVKLGHTCPCVLQRSLHGIRGRQLLPAVSQPAQRQVVVCKTFEVSGREDHSGGRLGMLRAGSLGVRSAKGISIHPTHPLPLHLKKWQCSRQCWRKASLFSKTAGRQPSRSTEKVAASSLARHKA